LLLFFLLKPAPYYISFGLSLATSFLPSKINADIAVNELITPLEQRRLKYAKKKMEFGSRQDEVTAATHAHAHV
jgi:hypothetical protein